MDEFIGLYAGGAAGGPEKGGSSGKEGRAALRRVEELEEDLERFRVILRAMWDLLRETVQVGEEELLERVRDIEAGGKGRTPIRCGGCDRPNDPRKTRCLYCGADLSHESAMDCL